MFAIAMSTDIYYRLLYTYPSTSSRIIFSYNRCIIFLYSLLNFNIRESYRRVKISGIDRRSYYFELASMRQTINRAESSMRRLHWEMSNHKHWSTVSKYNYEQIYVVETDTKDTDIPAGTIDNYIFQMDSFRFRTVYTKDIEKAWPSAFPYNHKA